MKIALDATYSLGDDLSGVGVYSREILFGMAAAHPANDFLFCYRPHRFVRSFSDRLPGNCHRRLLDEHLIPRGARLFHGLNQRLPKARFRLAVTTFHDLFVLTGEYSTPEFRRRFAEQARHAAAASDLIVTVSEFTATQVSGLLRVPRSRIRVVHHGVRTCAPSEARKEQIILHVGAIHTRKNVSRLVKAFESVPPEWKLVLAGGAGYGAPAIFEQIDGSPCRDRIRVLGYVSEATLADCYRRAMIFAFPSLDEGFGMPVLDAMAAGVPVVSSNRAALPEVCGDAAILVDPEDTGQLADALCELCQNEALRLELGRTGTANASRFSWKRAIARTFDVYRELLVWL